MAYRIFVDGQEGTTGLQINEYLARRSDVELLRIDPARRKDSEERARLLNAADVAFLCLPDAAAREAVTLVTNPLTCIIDASTAHRTADGWVYGFPELAPAQTQAVRDATRVSNPGCYATGAIAMLRPLVDAGLIPADYPLSLPSVSGYSGGGRTMIEAYEAGTAAPYEAYALGLSHKHIPEILRYTGLTRRPVFIPAVGNFRQGMLVQLPLHLDLLPGAPRASELHDVLTSHYSRTNTPEQWVSVLPPTDDLKLAADTLTDTNKLELRVFANEQYRQAVVIARLDNLGKGASGAAVQNLQLMLGV